MNVTEYRNKAVFIIMIIIVVVCSIILFSKFNFQRKYIQTGLDYNGYKTVVIISLDDLSRPSESWDNAIKMLVNKKLPHTVGVITNKADWDYIRDISDNEYTEIASHSRTHDKLSVENYDYESEIGGSKEEIFKNLGVTVVSYILPYGMWDDKVSKTLIENEYIVFRTHVNTPLVKGLYHSDHEIEMGNLWGTNDTETLNTAFDQSYKDNKIYHLRIHPAHVNWANNSYSDKHLSYISNRSDVWYVSMGDFYMYNLNFARASTSESRGSG